MPIVRAHLEYAATEYFPLYKMYVSNNNNKMSKGEQQNWSNLFVKPTYQERLKTWASVAGVQERKIRCN